MKQIGSFTLKSLSIFAVPSRKSYVNFNFYGTFTHNEIQPDFLLNKNAFQ